MKLMIRIFWFSIGLLVLVVSPILLINGNAESVHSGLQQPSIGISQEWFVQVFPREFVSFPDSIESYVSAIKLMDETGGRVDKLVLGGTFTLKEGETITGDLLNIGGSVTLETGSKVEGDIVIIGGSTQINGQVDGDVFALGGNTVIGATAFIQGELASIGGSLNLAENATIKGDVLEGITGPIPLPLPLNIPSFKEIPLYFNRWSAFKTNSVVEFGWMFIRSLVWSAIALFLSLFLSRSMETIGRTVVSQPVISGGMGLLTILVAPFAVILFAFTLIGIPISIFLVLILVFLWLFGIVSIGMETGVRITKVLHLNRSSIISAASGTFLLTMLLNFIRSFIPCIGGVIAVFIGIIGIGAVLLTRIGFREYPVLQDGSLTRTIEKENQGSGY